MSTCEISIETLEPLLSFTEFLTDPRLLFVADFVAFSVFTFVVPLPVFVALVVLVTGLLTPPFFELRVIFETPFVRGEIRFGRLEDAVCLTVLDLRFGGLDAAAVGPGLAFGGRPRRFFCTATVSSSA